jgi:hypothetical protein
MQLHNEHILVVSYIGATARTWQDDLKGNINCLPYAILENLFIITIKQRISEHNKEFRIYV